jgi:hypothetical protein
VYLATVSCSYKKVLFPKISDPIENSGDAAIPDVDKKIIIKEKKYTNQNHKALCLMA